MKRLSKEQLDELFVCKICMKGEPDSRFAMYDSDCLRPPLPFCSAECRYVADHMFDNLSENELERLEELILEEEIKLQGN